MRLSVIRLSGFSWVSGFFLGLGWVSGFFLGLGLVVFSWVLG